MEYIIFGADASGENCIYQMDKKIRIKGFFDNRKKGEFHGYRIQVPIYNKDYFILVAITNYFAARNQLLEIGYEEFADFCPYNMFGKKMVVMYGNCHVGAIKEYIERNVEFEKQYGIYPFPEIQQLIKTFSFEKIISKCDVLVYQPIREQNTYGSAFASNTILKYCKEDCYTISVPNLYGLAKCFFPSLIPVGRLTGIRNLFHYDVNVINWMKEEKTKKEMKKMIERGGVYKPEYIQDEWNRFLDKMFSRETEWDVKISDYILKNYKTKKLFSDSWHISSILAKEISVRLLNLLDIKADIPYTLPIMDGLEAFIYEDVKKALQLEFTEKYIRVFCKERVMGKMDMDMEEYLNQLINFTNRYGLG